MKSMVVIKVEVDKDNHYCGSKCRWITTDVYDCCTLFEKGVHLETDDHGTLRCKECLANALEKWVKPPWR